VAPPDRMVPDKDVCFYLFLYFIAGFAPQTTFRSVDVLGLEVDASTGAPESDRNRRRRGGMEMNEVA